MAVYHLKMSVGSRAGGQSAFAKSEYIEREGRYERDREELEDKEHENMPEWAEDDPRSYWAEADEYERANGRLYREVQFALPKELSKAERLELASGFARRLTEGEQLPYTLAIHRGGPDGENPHAHLMFSERSNDGIERPAEQWFKRYNAKEPEKGGARKSRVAVPRAWLEQTRKAWEQEANKELRRAGREERIDHRSLAERRDEADRSGDLELAAELSREPNVHLGPQAFGTLPGETDSLVQQKAERVEKENQALRQERSGVDERIEAKAQEISGIEQELRRIEGWIRETVERIAERARSISQDLGWSR